MSAPARIAAPGLSRRFLSDRVTLAASVILVVVAILCLVGPSLLPWDAETIDWQHIASPPDAASGHYFGTDSVGRDLLARTLRGGQVSLAVGLAASAVSLFIGLAWGAVAGYAGGRVDQVMMRIVDILYALPFMFLVIVLVTVFGRNIILVFVAIGAINWLDMARIVRGQTMVLKEREFVQAAEALGLPPGRILRRHIVPNLIGVVLVAVTLTVPQVILVESFLSFLGLGVQEPLTSWGELVNAGAKEMESAPWMLIFPAVFLATTLFCLNFIGDGLRDLLDPRRGGGGRAGT